MEAQFNELKEMLLNLSQRMITIEAGAHTPSPKRTPKRKHTPTQKTSVPVDHKDDAEDDADGTPITRTPSNDESKVTRDSVRYALFQLIDACWLAPKGETQLYTWALNKYHFNRDMFVKVATHVMIKNNLPPTKENIFLLDQLVRARRNYHQRGWRSDKKSHRPLRYFGTLGVVPPKLLEIMKNPLEQYEPVSQIMKQIGVFQHPQHMILILSLCTRHANLHASRHASLRASLHASLHASRHASLHASLHANHASCSNMYR